MKKKKQHRQKPYLGVQLQTLCVHNSDIFDLTLGIPKSKNCIYQQFFKIHVLLYVGKKVKEISQQVTSIHRNLQDIR